MDSDGIETAHAEVTKTTDEGTTTETSSAIKTPDGTIYDQSQTVEEPAPPDNPDA